MFVSTQKKMYESFESLLPVCNEVMQGKITYVKKTKSGEYKPDLGYDVKDAFTNFLIFNGHEKLIKKYKKEIDWNVFTFILTYMLPKLAVKLFPYIDKKICVEICHGTNWYDVLIKKYGNEEIEAIKKKEWVDIEKL